jgi:hypothetical protein
MHNESVAPRVPDWTCAGRDGLVSMASQWTFVAVMVAGLSAAGCSTPQPAPPPAQVASRGAIDRTVLPVQEPPAPTITEIDARNATAPPRFEVKAPEGAPNVVIVLIDDIGFGTSGTFGGPVNMPNLDRLAANGLKFNRFHTTALCSPTRTVADRSQSSRQQRRRHHGACDCVPW